MRQQPISRESKDIIDVMRVLIEKGETDHLKKSVTGWQYGGTNFTGLVASLHEEMKQELQRQDMHVVGCTVRHFFKGANITPSDPKKQLLIIPINGTSTLFPGGQLPSDTYCYIDDHPTLSGENIDVVFVVWELEDKGV